MEKRRKMGDIVTLIVLILMSVVVILPVLFMVTHSFILRRRSRFSGKQKRNSGGRSGSENPPRQMR